MANGHENLIPLNRRTKDEQRNIQSAGGKKSGKVRRRKAALRDTMNRLLTMRCEVEGLSDVLRADGCESTYEHLISMAMIERAALGDVKAYNAIMATVGQTDKSEADLEEQRIRTERAKRARDQEIGDNNVSEGNIQSFLKAMDPSQEDMNNLFAEGGMTNGEEAEETGGI